MSRQGHHPNPQLLVNVLGSKTPDSADSPVVTSRKHSICGVSGRSSPRATSTYLSDTCLAESTRRSGRERVGVDLTIRVRRQPQLRGLDPAGKLTAEHLKPPWTHTTGRGRLADPPPGAPASYLMSFIHNNPIRNSIKILLCRGRTLVQPDCDLVELRRAHGTLSRSERG